jgi:hypothetical protein
MKVLHNLGRTHAAEFSDDLAYRYRLRRSLTGDVLSAPERPVVFVMLNPSTADATTDDPTIRKCVGYAQRWGYTDILVANLFAVRSTDPSKLPTFADPVGPENDEVLQSLPRGVPTICGWGRDKFARNRTKVVAGLLRRPLLCLGVNGDGSPKHPLYLRGDICPQPWEAK